MLARGRDFDNYPVKLQGQAGNAGTLKVSLLAIDALRALDGGGGSSASRSLSGAYGQAPADADYPPPGSGFIEVEISSFAVSPALRNNQDVSDLWVEVDLSPQVADRSQLTTSRIHKLTSRLDFKFRQSIAIAPNSPEQDALRRMLEEPNEEASDVFFNVQSVSPHNHNVEVGVAFLNLRKLLDEGRDVSRAQCIVKGRNGVSMGTLTVSLTALQVLRDAMAGGGPAPAPGRGGVGRQSSASRFVDSFGGQAPAPATARATAQPARAGAQPARAGAQPARAGAPAPSAAARFLGAPAAAEGNPDSVLSIRLESVSLGSSTQRDPQIPFFLLAAKILGKTYSTPEVRKTSPPIRINHSFEVPVPQGSPEFQSLTRVMQYGKRETADIVISLEFFDPNASSGGDEPEQLAFGAINLRQLWEGRRDLQSQRIELLTDQGEVTTVTLSTSVIPAIERALQPRR